MYKFKWNNKLGALAVIGILAMGNWAQTLATDTKTTQTEKSQAAQAAQAADMALYTRVITNIAGKKIPNRSNGTVGNKMIQRYLVGHFKEIALTPPCDEKFTQEHIYYEKKIINVVGAIPGVGQLKDQWLIIGGHYDHIGSGLLGMGNDTGKIYPGADDNASGTAGVILLSKSIKEQVDIMDDANRRSILFCCFDAEEIGLFGSKMIADNLADFGIKDAGSVIAMLNMDMIGRVRDKEIHVFATGTAKQWNAILDKASIGIDLDIQRDTRIFGQSDHASFIKHDIPVLFFNSGLHKDFHSTRDTVDKINFTGAVKTVNLIENIALELIKRDQMLSKIKPNTLGVGMMDNKNRANDILQISSIAPDSVAAKAGLQKGDELLQWQGKPINNFKHLRLLINQAQKDTNIKLTIQRSGKEMSINIRFTG
ncbi:MAG: M28 family peptidase [Phycisphaerae bacterium]|nr:M28 family peptidase [Phycisphaerae bacterium]